MKTSTFEKFRSLVYQQSGIDLGPGKAPLVAGRVCKRMRLLGISDEHDYLGRVLDDPSGDELVHLLDAISTNYTHFFREQDHFDLLTKLAQQRLAADRSPRLRIWSAACSSGQEPYSIGMTLCEAARAGRCNSADFRILATDISTRVLARAAAGQYSLSELDGVPRDIRPRYFTRLGGDSSEPYAVSDELRRMVTFRRLNLSRPPFPMQGPFDMVFCRNVMIYFDHAVRTRLLQGIERLLRDGGVLLVGHTESLAGISTNLRMVAPSVYKKVAKS